MIRNSFVFLDKIGLTKEKLIWQSGVRHWDDFLRAGSVSGIGKARKFYYNMQVRNAEKELEKDNSCFFADRMPKSEMWRLYETFKDDALFLDIETTEHYGDITVIGMYDGKESNFMVRGFNLDKDKFYAYLEQFKLIITYNGLSFDQPVIERYFGKKFTKIPHLDLRHACARIGLVGGLKTVERTLGIDRDEEVANVMGSDAIYLWSMWKATGKREYLDRLIRYNEYDIVNLKPIAEHVCSELSQTLNALSPQHL
ncbi:ribonuclease H-like domain-containing protein [Candidatus Woesearchaeota archaeon]|nr:ribonuclease H-like domain-containing protein [Candidatus Woesearchaeota archaeon]